jgi:hypothetical protein
MISINLRGGVYRCPWCGQAGGWSGVIRHLQRMGRFFYEVW